MSTPNTPLLVYICAPHDDESILESERVLCDTYGMARLSIMKFLKNSLSCHIPLFALFAFKHCIF